MYRGTTPTLCFTVMTELDLSKVKQMWVTLQNLVYERTYSGDEVRIDDKQKKVYVDMTQEETLSFSAGKIDIQIRMLMDDDRAYATEIVTTTVDEVLKDGVIKDDSVESGGAPGDISGSNGEESADSNFVTGGFNVRGYR